jgi:hypothetical protein
MARGESNVQSDQENSVSAAEIAAAAMADSIEEEVEGYDPSTEVSEQSNAIPEVDQSVAEEEDADEEHQPVAEPEEQAVQADDTTVVEEPAAESVAGAAPVIAESTEGEDTAIVKRRKRNEKFTKGYNLQGFRLYRAGDLPAETPVYVMVVGPDQECRTDRDIREVMNERDLRGEIIPMRPLPPIIRQVKEVVGFI